MSEDYHVDPVTGAPLLRRRSTSRTRTGYPTAVAMPVFAPPYGYSYAGYMPGAYLTPTAPAAAYPLPPMSPIQTIQPNPPWQQAYYYYYPNGTPYTGTVTLPTGSPANRPIGLPSPRASPYSRPTFLPDDVSPFDIMEDRERQGWATRMADWFGAQEEDPYAEFYPEINIHRSLDKKGDILKWNVSHPPFTIYVSNVFDPHVSAFEPPLSEARIVSRVFPWVIDVKAHKPYQHITIMSLLGDIYHALRSNIDRQTYESYSPRFKEQLKEAFYRRCYSIPDTGAWDNAVRSGLKWVDFTLNRKNFAGIKQVKDRMLTFELKLSA